MSKSLKGPHNSLFDKVALISTNIISNVLVLIIFSFVNDSVLNNHIESATPCIHSTNMPC